MECWGLRARNTELLHFISPHPVDLICIQESNLNSSSSFRIHGFSALQFDGTYSRSGIFSTDVTDASGGIIIFVRQGLSFSELSTSSFSSLNPCSDYIEVNISLNASSSLSFLNVYAPSIPFVRRIAEPISFLPPLFPPMWKRKWWNFRASASTEKGPVPPLLLPASTSASTSLIVMFSVAPDLNFSLTVEHYILLILCTFLFTGFPVPLTNTKLSDKFHTRENLFIITIIYHYSVPGV